MKEIILIRGVPGSGKTTYAQELAIEKNMATVEADSWHFIKKNEEESKYEFNADNLESAHRWCILQAERFARLGRGIIISNTFITAAECAPYYVIAEKYDLPVTIMTMTGNYGTIHDVPDIIVESMKLRFESDDSVRKLFVGKDLSLFYNDPFKAKEFFSMYRKVFCNV